MNKIIDVLKSMGIEFEVLNDSDNYGSIMFNINKKEYIIDQNYNEFIIQYPDYNSYSGSKDYIIDIINKEVNN